jgi:hypothetical protein
MDVKVAAEKLIPIVNRQTGPIVSDGFGNTESPFFPKGGKKHLTYMCESIISGEVVGEKAHRWIGWLQGCLYMNGLTTLDEMKELNKRA